MGETRVVNTVFIVLVMTVWAVVFSDIPRSWLGELSLVWAVLGGLVGAAFGFIVSWVIVSAGKNLCGGGGKDV